MAEIRKHDPDAGEGIARLVRQHMGDIRPVEPGTAATPADEAGEDADQQESAPDAGGFSGIPNWDESGPTFQF